MCEAFARRHKDRARDRIKAGLCIKLGRYAVLEKIGEGCFLWNIHIKTATYNVGCRNLEATVKIWLS